ncbi:MAG TPA: Fur family transcriptional regulator [Candidatus Saccharimonadales bacterium]|nr:Fur family transcriptional regulator [Candidatus Saccharimonadales bacterium]
MSTNETRQFQAVLAASGYSLTRPRQIVFDLLIAPEPQSMAELVKKAAGKIDRASVYRTVALFEELGIAHRIYIGWKYKLELSDQFLAHHHHLSCLRCGKVVDIHDDARVEAFITGVAEQFGFAPRRHQLEVDGWCAVCQAETAKQSN